MIICSPGLLLLGGLNSGKSAELWIPDSQECPNVRYILVFFCNFDILNWVFKESNCNFILGSLQGRRICSLPDLHRPMAAHTVNVGDQGRFNLIISGCG